MSRQTVQDLKNTYTDAPQLHSNLLLGGLQLLAWLFFHPTAWRNHIARIDADLRPDFCLAELSAAQWRNPALRRVLLMGYVPWPPLIGLLLGLALWVMGQPVTEIAHYATEVALRASGGLVVGAAFGVPFGIVVGVIFSLVSAVECVIGGTLGSLSAVAAGLALGVMVSMAGRRSGFSFARQIGSAVLGGLIGGAALGLIALAAYVVSAGAPPGVPEFVRAETPSLAAHLIYKLVGIEVGGLAVGAVIGWRTRQWRRGVEWGVGGGAVIAIVEGIARVAANSLPPGLANRGMFGVVHGEWDGTLHGVWLALPYALVEPLMGPWAGAIAGMLTYGGWATIRLASGNVTWGSAFASVLLGILPGLTLPWWRPVALYPFLTAWNQLLLRADERNMGKRPSWLRYHSTFWDEFQRLPLLGLDEHLVLVMERDPVEGQAALEYVAASPQRWAAQAAQIELDARSLEKCDHVETLRQAYRSLAAGELEGPASALLRSLSRISRDVEAALSQANVYHQRQSLDDIEDRLDGLVRELTRSSERYAVRFRPIAARWRQIVGEHARELARQAELRQEIDNPYVIGVPLTQQQEIFVGRTDISARIESLLLDQRRPPLLLYGQRRMGKTSLLNNLGRLLPSTIVPFLVDLQGPTTQSSDHAGFLYNVARGMSDSARRLRGLTLPPLTREMLAIDPSTRFDEWLDQVQDALGTSTALLALDEFETLENAFAKGRLDEEAVLGMLRHLIQHRPRFKVLLAGSHVLDELRHWASYLINVQVVHLTYLKENEARQLIEQPVEGFALRYIPTAVQRVLELTRGHPFLIQLLCSEIVTLKNEHPFSVRRLACPEDVEVAIPAALSHGSFFFADIQYNQIDATGLAVLHFMATQGEGTAMSRETLVRRFPDELEQALAFLCQRELIEPVDGGYRLQVELIRRWFAQQ